MKKVTLLFFLSLSSVLYSQDLPKEIVSKFFSDYEKGSVSIAIDNLYQTNEWMATAEEAISYLKENMEKLDLDFVGKYYGYELIVEKKINDSFILLSYLVKFDRQPFRYTFEFYKPDAKWKIYSLQFDSNLDEEIEEAAKLNNMYSKN